MAIDDLEWLGTWYRQQCNGTWEHQKGMLLEPARLSTSTAHSGWRLRIDLRGTEAAGYAPRNLAVCEIHGPWLRCALNASRFEGEGAEVETLIGIFRKWIDDQPPLQPILKPGPHEPIPLEPRLLEPGPLELKHMGTASAV